jgi:hypothetical protein
MYNKYTIISQAWGETVEKAEKAVQGIKPDPQLSTPKAQPTFFSNPIFYLEPDFNIETEIQTTNQHQANVFSSSNPSIEDVMNATVNTYLMMGNSLCRLLSDPIKEFMDVSIREYQNILWNEGTPSGLGSQKMTESYRNLFTDEEVLSKFSLR